MLMHSAGYVALAVIVVVLYEKLVLPALGRLRGQRWARWLPGLRRRER